MSDDAEQEVAPDPETIEFFLDRLADVNAEQVAAVEGRDAKAVQVFAAASVVVGLVATSERAMCAELLVGATIAYVFVGLAVGFALWPRSLAVRPYDALWKALAHEPPREAGHTLVHLLASAYPDNERVLRIKRWALVAALVAAGLETFLVALALTTSSGAR
jgi:hypothetical protein